MFEIGWIWGDVIYFYFVVDFFFVLGCVGFVILLLILKLIIVDGRKVRKEYDSEDDCMYLFLYLYNLI